jgi:hypothetical protein
VCENLIQNLEHLFLFHSIVPTRYGFTRFDVPTFKKRSMINLLVELRSCYGSIEPVASPFLWGPMEHIQRNRLLSYSEIETMGSLWGFAVKPFAEICCSNFPAGLAPQNLTPTTLPSVTFFLQVCYMFSWLWGSDFGVPN